MDNAFTGYICLSSLIPSKSTSPPAEPRYILSADTNASDGILKKLPIFWEWQESV